MKLIKYDRAKGGGVSGTTIINSTTSSSSNQGGNAPTRVTDRIIWGQDDDGVDDVDGSMTVNGNVTIKAIVPPSYVGGGDDDDGDGEVIEEETGGGNLDVAMNIHAGKEVSSESVKASKNVTSPEVYGKKVFLDRNNIKTNVLDLINDHEARINQNKTDITNLKGRVSSAESRISQNETDIAALRGRVSSAESDISTINNNITTINSDIVDIKTRLDNLGSGGSGSGGSGGSGSGSGGSTGGIVNAINDLNDKVTNGRINHPIILWSGRLYRLGSDRNQTSNTSWDTISYCKHADFGAFSVAIQDGLMTLSLSSFNEAKLNVASVNVNQYRAFDTQDLSRTKISNRNEGAHFFEARTDAPTNTTKIYIREFHNGGGDNDSWDSNSWVNNNGINSIFVTIFGYVTPKESSSGDLGDLGGLGCGCEEDITDLKNRVTALENKPDKDTIYDDTDLKNRVTALENNLSSPTKTILLKAPTDPNEGGMWNLNVNKDMVVILSGKESNQRCSVRMSDKTTIPDGRKITFVNTDIVSNPWKIGRTGDIFCLYSYKSDDPHQMNGFNKSNVLGREQYVDLAGGHSATLVYCKGTWYQIAD